MAYGRGRDSGARGFQRLMSSDMDSSERPARRRKMKRRMPPKSKVAKRGSAKARSREFMEGRLYEADRAERERLAAYRRSYPAQPGDYEEGRRYSPDTGYANRIGWRS